MTVLHGDCTGPEGSHIWHGTCPRSWPRAHGGTWVCECGCHDDEKPQEALEIRASGAEVCENGSGPEGALTPESPALTPHHSTQPRSEG
jgi:hypothetical protein